LVYLASSAIIFLGFLSINTGQVLRGSVHTFQNYYLVLTGKTQTEGVAASVNDQGYQEVTINVQDTKYISSNNVLKAGVPVRLTLNTENVSGCIRAFMIPSLNVSEILPVTGQKTIEFIPTKTGQLSYSCSMGMYSGTFTVVN
jgi:uncharacterized protein